MSKSDMQYSNPGVTYSVLISEAVYRVVVGVERLFARCVR